MAEQKRLFLLDAYALIFRGYYAFIKNPRINSKGMDTSAILGFTNSLLDVIRRENPDHLAVAFDKGGSVARTEAFPEYKANRLETPEAIKIAVPSEVGVEKDPLAAPGDPHQVADHRHVGPDATQLEVGLFAVHLRHGQVEQQPDARRQSLEEPHVADRAGQLDVTHALAADLGQGHLYTALLAHYTAVL